MYDVHLISVGAVRRYDAHHPSIVKGNTLLSANSENANFIIGIDVQGDSKSVNINCKNNVVDLDGGENKLGLRVREFTDGDGFDAIVVGNSKLAQGAEILNLRKLRNKPALHSHGDELEWQLGGCPFAKARSSTYLRT